MCSGVLHRMIGATSVGDDVAMLVAHRLGTPSVVPLSIVVPAVTRTLSDVRSSVRRWLAARRGVARGRGRHPRRHGRGVLQRRGARVRARRRDPGRADGAGGGDGRGDGARQRAMAPGTRAGTRAGHRADPPVQRRHGRDRRARRHHRHLPTSPHGEQPMTAASVVVHPEGSAVRIVMGGEIDLENALEVEEQLDRGHHQRDLGGHARPGRPRLPRQRRACGCCSPWAPGSRCCRSR